MSSIIARRRVHLPDEREELLNLCRCLVRGVSEGDHALHVREVLECGGRGDRAHGVLLRLAAARRGQHRGPGEL